jgi:hypothetical protein
LYQWDVICELSFKIQRILPLPLPYNALKYLIYLIKYDLLSYDEQSQVYITEDGWLSLLETICKEKKNSMTNNEIM